MHSASLFSTRSRWRRKKSDSKDDDEFSESSLSSLSRPSTQDSKRSSCSRLSTDSGAGSLDDFKDRRNSSPDFWRNSIGRRHTAPIKKTFFPTDEEESIRPSTVHVWEGCSPRCSLSRYAPLPAIGVQKDNQSEKQEEERPFPVRRQCFMGPLDIDDEELISSKDVNQNELEEKSLPPVFSLTLISDSDSDFEDDSDVIPHCGADDISQCVSEEEDGQKPKKALIRSATFTIEKERPDIRGPFITVAVRLPDGSRVAHRFDCKDMLDSVCKMALDKMEGPCPQKYSLVTTDVPKRIFKDMTITLKDAGISDKTLLYLQSCDDSDSD